MFDIAPSELMLLAAVALVVIGPKDLPKAMRFVGQWIGRARGMARHFRSGIDEIIRQAELDEMQKKWAAENARIMAEHPAPDEAGPRDAALALAPPEAEAAATHAPIMDEDHRRALAASVEPEPDYGTGHAAAMAQPIVPVTDASDPVEPRLPLGEPHRHEGERDDRG